MFTEKEKIAPKDRNPRTFVQSSKSFRTSTFDRGTGKVFGSLNQGPASSLSRFPCSRFPSSSHRGESFEFCIRHNGLLPPSRGFLFTRGSTSQGFQQPPKKRDGDESTDGQVPFKASSSRLTAEGFKSTSSLNDPEQRFIPPLSLDFYRRVISKTIGF